MEQMTVIPWTCWYPIIQVMADSYFARELEDNKWASHANKTRCIFAMGNIFLYIHIYCIMFGSNITIQEVNCG